MQARVPTSLYLSAPLPHIALRRARRCGDTLDEIRVGAEPRVGTQQRYRQSRYQRIRDEQTDSDFGSRRGDQTVHR